MRRLTRDVITRASVFGRQLSQDFEGVLGGKKLGPLDLRVTDEFRQFLKVAQKGERFYFTENGLVLKNSGSYLNLGEDIMPYRDITYLIEDHLREQCPGRDVFTFFDKFFAAVDCYLFCAKNIAGPPEERQSLRCMQAEVYKCFLKYLQNVK